MGTAEHLAGRTFELIYRFLSFPFSSHCGSNVDKMFLHAGFSAFQFVYIELITGIAQLIKHQLVN